MSVASPIPGGCGDDETALGGSGMLVAPSTSTTDDGGQSTAAVDAGTPLPEGCGDGIIDPAQLCYSKQRLVWEDLDVGVLSDVAKSDLDQDGRAELLVFAKPVGDPFADLMLVAYDDGRLVKRWQMEPGIGTLAWPTVDRDLDGDGDPDVLIQGSQGFLATYENEAGVLSPVQILAEVPYQDYWVPRGFSIPFDADADGVIDKLLGTIWEPGEALGGWIFERAGDRWMGAEGPILLDGCQSFGESVIGDFDGDGVDDVVVRELGAICDPYPPSYDPEWWRFYVFLGRPEVETMYYAGSYPAGGTHRQGIYRLDFDDDGRLDLIFDVSQGISFIRGNGDGTFEAPLVYGPTGNSSLHLIDIVDIDGDDEPDMLLSVDARLVFAPLETNPAHLRPLNDLPEGVDLTAVADFNGDGLADFLFKDEESPANPRDGILLISAP
jgi:FG-GAP-like repeat